MWTHASSSQVRLPLAVLIFCVPWSFYFIRRIQILRFIVFLSRFTQKQTKKQKGTNYLPFKTSDSLKTTCLGQGQPWSPPATTTDISAQTHSHHICPHICQVKSVPSTQCESPPLLSFTGLFHPQHSSQFYTSTYFYLPPPSASAPQYSDLPCEACRLGLCTWHRAQHGPDLL